MVISSARTYQVQPCVLTTNEKPRTIWNTNNFAIRFEAKSQHIFTRMNHVKMKLLCEGKCIHLLNAIT